MTTPPGWYDDGHGAMRWWDGANWTEHVAEPDVEAVPGQLTAVTAPLYGAQQSTAATVPLYPGAQPYAETLPLGPGAAGIGYPGGYPTQGGAFIAATEPRRSRLWIVWVVLGVIVLGIVVALAVLIPLFFMALPTGSSSSGPPTGTSTEAPADDLPTTADEQAASDAVVRFNQSIQTNDCAAYFASTTDAFRSALEVTDCDEFAAATESFADDYQDYVLVVASVDSDGESISVNTVESYRSAYDDDGNETAEPQDYEDHFIYIVVSSDDGWVIDESYSSD